MWVGARVLENQLVKTHWKLRAQRQPHPKNQQRRLLGIESLGLGCAPSQVGVGFMVLEALPALEEQPSQLIQGQRWWWSGTPDIGQQVTDRPYART